jgi:hypothetical protein
VDTLGYVSQGLTEIGHSNAFANAFWILIGIVIGVLIQYLFHRVQGSEQRRNALKVIEIEVALNLDIYDTFLSRVKHLRGKISSGQVKAEDLYFDMSEFDFSAMHPLVNSGYFHVELGVDKVRRYYRFVRFFSSINGNFLTGQLRDAHASSQSLDFLDQFERRCEELRVDFQKTLKN